MPPKSTLATEEPRPPVEIYASYSDLWFEGKEAQNIFRTFKTLTALHILTKGKKKSILRDLKKSASNTLDEWENRTYWGHFLSVSRN